jgi:hypothetical protein
MSAVIVGRDQGALVRDVLMDIPEAPAALADPIGSFHLKRPAVWLTEEEYRGSTAAEWDEYEAHFV